MIFARPKPWQNQRQRQRQLLRACFHVDDAKAVALALRWFQRFDINETAYPEHRLLVRLLGRFPEISLPSDAAVRISGLKRQLWVRGNLNLQATQSAFAALEGFDIPWVLTGAAQWFVQPKTVVVDSADTIELTVPDAARSAAVHALVQSGWKRAGQTPEAAAGPVFTRLTKGHGNITVSKAGALLCYAPEQARNMWTDRIVISQQQGQFFVPDSVASLWIALGRTHPAFAPDQQWVFDMFNLFSNPLKGIALAQLPPKVAQRLQRQIKALGCFD